jgi:hypothetical protein
VYEKVLAAMTEVDKRYNQRYTRMGEVPKHCSLQVFADGAGMITAPDNKWLGGFKDLAHAREILIEYANGLR